MKKSELKQLIKEIINDEKSFYNEISTFHDKWKSSKDIPHPYNTKTTDIAKHIIAKAARIRDEYHMTYEEALRAILAYINADIERLGIPPEKFPA
jgi:predicted patatin/cPLA2 family phospholipase